ncbi:hypothetical protein GCM10022405_08090 [Gibbsiella dentisursi]|uniref:Transposase n=1 Tax=Gibbsiella dentisursi TaxID=796890 RepID=A0ABP7KQS7_9GAMM
MQEKRLRSGGERGTYNAKMRAESQNAVQATRMIAAAANGKRGIKVILVY